MECAGMRVDDAIQPMALGKSERAQRARLRPAPVTMVRESPVARFMPRLS